MTSPCWQLDASLARLQRGPLRATIDLTQPATGLRDVYVGAASLGDARLLSLGIPTAEPNARRAPIERYVRGADLVAAYEASSDWPVHVDALWRAAVPAAGDPFLAVMEVIISVRTQLVESRPALMVESTVAAEETFHLLDAASAEYRPWTPSSRIMLPEEGTGCLLFRLQGAELSYAEMVHPADFRRDALERVASAAATVCLKHHLFSEPLEKGVLLRCRVRGVFLPRRDDMQAAAACYRALAAAEPPLEA